MGLLGKDLGIDLGTVNTLVSDGGEIVLHEPTMVAVDVEELKIVEVGQAAREMDGRVPDIIEVIRPMREVVIADFEITMRMLRIFVEKVCGPARLFKPRAMITVPYGVTSVESRAVHEAALQAGNREVYLIQEPLAAAIGVGLPIATPSGNLVVILGGGVTQAAVLAMSGIVVADSVRVGGMKMDEAIASYVRKKYGLVISQRTAQATKMALISFDGLSISNPAGFAGSVTCSQHSTESPLVLLRFHTERSSSSNLQCSLLALLTKSVRMP